MRRFLSTMAQTTTTTTAATTATPRRFAPLKESASGAADGSGLPKLQGIVFDVDGTLW